MSTRRASCSCGQLTITCEGDPVRISVCHCLECQRRTGSAFGAQARFAPSQIVASEGRASEYTRKGDSGGVITFRFCPTCGSTVSFQIAGDERVAIALGAFADPQFPPPQYSVYEARRHSWVEVPGVEHHD